jgi:hypothetical protein
MGTVTRALGTAVLLGAGGWLIRRRRRDERGVEEPPPRLHLGAPVATPPLETPGPSVTPPRLPFSESEREEWADERRPDQEVLGTADPLEQLIAEEESAAAAEARAIGGFAPHSADPAMDPVYEAGGGDQDGFEQAEQDLIDNATHGDGRGNPARDALRPEAESDRSSAQYGEGDEEYSSEVLRDPGEGPDDPGAGPGLTHDR